MIRNEDVKLPVRHKMAESKYTFYLTGSRFFERATKHSEWDYFVEDDELVFVGGVREFLLANGFNPLPYSYNDSSVTAVYWHPENIHVQIVKDAEKRDAIQHLLKKHGWGGEGADRSFWNLLFAVSDV